MCNIAAAEYCRDMPAAAPTALWLHTRLLLLLLLVTAVVYWFSCPKSYFCFLKVRAESRCYCLDIPLITE